jgi:hypothetical protein
MSSDGSDIERERKQREYKEELDRQIEQKRLITQQGGGLSHSMGSRSLNRPSPAPVAVHHGEMASSAGGSPDSKLAAGYMMHPPHPFRV